ncbi:MAG: nucleotide exchange factor GrpE [Nitrososphaerales archaeon]
MSPSFPSNDVDPAALEPGAQFPEPEEQGELSAQGYWVRLTSQMDRLQASMDAVLAATQANESQVEVLLRHLTDPARGQQLDERLAGLLAGQEAGQAQWEALAASLSELAQAVAKLNRTQFKTNALAEMKDQQVATALGTLQDAVTRREQAQEARSVHGRESAAALRAEARGEFAAELLPALDGLELALESGRAMLARRRQQEDEAARGVQAQNPAFEPEPARPGLGQRLAWAISGRGPLPGAAASNPPSSRFSHRDEMAEVAAWLHGLELVRTRFLALLATAGVYPIEAEGQPFDPRLHLAMATEHRGDAPDGAVVAVLRKGYRQRGRVLRYAEVAVNHTAGPVIASPADGAPAGGSSTGSAPGDPDSAPRQDYLRQDNSSEGSDI